MGSLDDFERFDDFKEFWPHLRPRGSIGPPRNFFHNFVLLNIFPHRFLGMKLDGRSNFYRKNRSPTYRVFRFYVCEEQIKLRPA